MALRGVSLLGATSIVAEIGDLTRFASAPQLMAYLGLVPSEHSSGAKQTRGGITKTGNIHVRRLIIEAAWAYRHPARKTKCIQQRAKRSPQEAQDELRPRDFVTLSALRSINSTGSPLPNDAYAWVYDAVKPDLWLASISGGTDIASGFVACAPILAVTAGEIQCRELGVSAYAFDESGNTIVNEVGELVVTKPMPSMPVFFWNDAGGKRYRESYFEQYVGVWRHGDWIRFTPQGTSVIYGRSDTTINRYGIRMGTAEIYRVVEELPEVRDSLVVDLEYLGKPSYMPLFVVLNTGFNLDAALKDRIVQQIKTKASARHVPNEIFAITEVPRTLTGKKMELPVRKLLLGMEASTVASADAMANPNSFDFFVDLAKRLNN
jgi:acetoacetyl-CoA synthetase